MVASGNYYLNEMHLIEMISCYNLAGIDYCVGMMSLDDYLEIVYLLVENSSLNTNPLVSL
jgi:hypothetical protein